MKGWIIVNGFLATNKFQELYGMLSRAALALAGKVKTPRTVIAPKTFEGVGYNKLDFVENATRVYGVTSIGSSAFYYCSSLTIFCEATSESSGWGSYWNSSNCPVVWGYTG